MDIASVWCPQQDVWKNLQKEFAPRKSRHKFLRGSEATVIWTIANNTANSGVVKQESPEWVHSASAEFFLAGSSFLPHSCVCPSRD